MRNFQGIIFIWILIYGEIFKSAISVPLKFQIHAYLKICYISLLPSVISFAWWMIMVCIVFWRCSFILFWSFSILIPYRKLAGVKFEPPTSCLPCTRFNHTTELSDQTMRCAEWTGSSNHVAQVIAKWLQCPNNARNYLSILLTFLLCFLYICK